MSETKPMTFSEKAAADKAAADKAAADKAAVDKAAATPAKLGETKAKPAAKAGEHEAKPAAPYPSQAEADAIKDRTYRRDATADVGAAEYKTR